MCGCGSLTKTTAKCTKVLKVKCTKSLYKKSKKCPCKTVCRCAKTKCCKPCGYSRRCGCGCTSAW